ncbi:hypothetical protein ACI2KT_33505 [Ensifer adhaerens]|uniref:hypothetical protein n=1 Tax=Ensifer adhaerens TaxID=106592 RepID=UPI00384A83B6
MRIIVVIGLVAAAILAGCSSAREMARMNTYNFEGEPVEFEGESFRVYRHKSEQSLMVSPVAATQAAPKFVTPLTFDQKLRSTAERYLRDGGERECVVGVARPLGNEVYEFPYKCK